MTLGKAVRQGHLDPKTSWRAYSFKTHTHQTPTVVSQSQMVGVGPPSPGSVVSSHSYRVSDFTVSCHRNMVQLSDHSC